MLLNFVEGQKVTKGEIVVHCREQRERDIDKNSSNLISFANYHLEVVLLDSRLMLFPVRPKTKTYIALQHLTLAVGVISREVAIGNKLRKILV